MTTDLLFVYGTLRRAASHPMHRLLLPATFIGAGTFQGRLYDLGSYPGAVPSADPADRVHGEVYRLHDPVATLARLDHYEGCAETDAPPTEYIRAVADIALPAAGFVRAHLYLYQRPTDTLRRLASGDYLAPG